LCIWATTMASVLLLLQSLICNFCQESLQSNCFSFLAL
jgi:hypothetical protein